MTTTIQLPTLADVLKTLGSTFATSTIEKGAYFKRSLALQALAATTAQELYMTCTTSQFITLRTIIGREFQRYYGTYKGKDGAAVRLAFPTTKHAVRYFANLKRAGDVVQATAKLVAEVAELEALANEA